MYKNHFAYLLLASTLLPSSLSVRAAEIHHAVSRQCVSQIEVTEKKLLEVSNLNLVEAGTDKYPDAKTGRPVYATHYVYFITEEAGGENLMNSPVLMKSMATELFSQCGAAGSVIFGLRQSDRSEVFGKMTDGTIQKFDCAEDSTNITWGEQPCS